jgi:hypothetical protein
LASATSEMPIDLARSASAGTRNQILRRSKPEPVFACYGSIGVNCRWRDRGGVAFILCHAGPEGSLAHSDPGGEHPAGRGLAGDPLDCQGARPPAGPCSAVVCASRPPGLSAPGSSSGDSSSTTPTRQASSAAARRSPPAAAFSAPQSPKLGDLTRRRHRRPSDVVPAPTKLFEPLLL